MFEKVTDFTGTEEDYIDLLTLISKKRKKPTESQEDCFKRLCADSERFVKIYTTRKGKMPYTVLRLIIMS